MAFYGRKEELLNTWSHACGILLGVVIGALFIWWCAKHSDQLATWGIALYLFGMLGSYIASTVYHALPADTPAKNHLRKWDHAAIYWHIAGSYSPLTLVVLWEQGLWGLLL
ncbi:MAG: hemolysin III family protein, partial [Bacteroidaceae bacterium]|nr:hemolysin III family protein [Bacteroidaceae bacterium]